MDQKINKQLDKNIEIINKTLANCDDIVKRYFLSGKDKNIKTYIVYTDNIVKGDKIEDFIMTNLMNRTSVKSDGSENILTKINNEAISIGEMKEAETFKELFDAVLLGDTAILVDGENKCLIASTKGWPSRGVQQAETEVVIQGPKDSFTEVGSTNTVLVRRRIRDTRLKVKRSKVGVRSKTDIAVMYMEDIVRKDVLEETERRLKSINIDAILDSGSIEQIIEKDWLSPFPQMQLTERPDKTASAILEGRIAIIVDNTPFAILVPVTMNLFFQAAEDYYERWEIMSFMRLIRYGAALVAIALPGLYIALSVYHPEMLPTALALKIAGSRAKVPFPTVAEVLIMETAFELLREAGIRLPSPVSSTIGIVGGIIIGQAAVEAGIVGPVVVIVASLTGICTFAIPNTSFVSGLRLSKYLIIFLSSILGLYGFWLGLTLLLIHLANLKSFGIPYLYPFCSGEVNGYEDFKDSIFRMPYFMRKKRPIFSNKRNRIRMK